MRLLPMRLASSLFWLAGFSMAIVLLGSASGVSAQATTAQPAKAPATAAPGSCLQCHGTLIKQVVKHGVAEDCSTCHVQGRGNVHTFTFAAEGGALCTSCHEVQKPTDKFVHGPVAVGDCVSCHNPHGAPNPKLLKLAGAQVCETCHEDMTAKLGAKRYTHAPVKTDCAGCHDPHASAFKYQLKAQGSALCLGCHKDTKQKIDTSPVKHEAVTMGAQCQNCHEVHASDVRPVLKAASMPLCLSCHDKELPLPNGGVVQNIKAWLDANPNAHGPIREQDCVGCHKPHESEHFRLLKQGYPAKFYSPYDPANYALCFNCHQPDLVRVERTSTLTGFRNGDRNLHFVHVNRPDKGRTCRACHEVHSSTRARHIRDKVPFGTWQLPIKFESVEDGGKCAPGCHVPYDYRRAAAATATKVPD